MGPVRSTLSRRGIPPGGKPSLPSKLLPFKALEAVSAPPPPSCSSSEDLRSQTRDELPKLLEEGEGGISRHPSPVSRRQLRFSAREITMVKIGRSVVTSSDDGPDKGLPGKKARPPTYSTTLESQNIKELITVILVRHGYDRHSETRRMLVIDSEMSFTDFRSRVCETLGLSDSYPVRLTVEDVRSAINGGTRMGTLSEEAMEHVRNEGVLYVRH